MKLSQQLICYFIFRRILPVHTKDKLGDDTTTDDDDDELPPWLRWTEQAGPDAPTARGAEEAGPPCKMKDAEVQTANHVEPPLVYYRHMPPPPLR